MPEPIYVLVIFALRFIEILSLAMFVRAILSWFIMDGEGKFMRFLYVLTEPVVYPFRKLFYKLNWFQGTPVDVSFICGILSLSLMELVINLLC